MDEWFPVTGVSAILLEKKENSMVVVVWIKKIYIYKNDKKRKEDYYIIKITV